MKSPILPPYYQGICYIVELIISINYNEEMVSIPQLVRIKGVTRSTWAHRVCAEIERWGELSTMRALGKGGDEYSSTAFPLNPDELLAVDMRFVARITLGGASHMPIFTSIATRALPGWKFDTIGSFS